MLVGVGAGGGFGCVTHADAYGLHPDIYRRDLYTIALCGCVLVRSVFMAAEQLRNRYAILSKYGIPIEPRCRMELSYIYNMTTLMSIKQTLTQLKPELKQKFFVNSIGLFGSVVRADFTEASDIDIIVDFSKPVGMEFIDLADFIEKKLKTKVDLVSKNGVKAKYFHEIEREIIYV